MSIGMDEDIARRELHNSDGSVVTVVLGKPGLGPVPGQGTEDKAWCCQWRIEGLEPQPVEMRSFGVDSVQALTSALFMIGARLQAHETAVTFLGTPDLRFPRSPV